MSIFNATSTSTSPLTLYVLPFPDAAKLTGTLGVWRDAAAKSMLPVQEEKDVRIVVSDRGNMGMAWHGSMFPFGDDVNVEIGTCRFCSMHVFTLSSILVCVMRRLYSCHVRGNVRRVKLWPVVCHTCITCHVCSTKHAC